MQWNWSNSMVELKFGKSHMPSLASYYVIYQALSGKHGV